MAGHVFGFDESSPRRVAKERRAFAQQSKIGRDREKVRSSANHANGCLRLASDGWSAIQPLNDVRIEKRRTHDDLRSLDSVAAISLEGHLVKQRCRKRM